MVVLDGPSSCLSCTRRINVKENIVLLSTLWKAILVKASDHDLIRTVTKATAAEAPTTVAARRAVKGSMRAGASQDRSIRSKLELIK